MFTGIVEAVGHVDDVRSSADGSRVRIATALGGALAAGDSVAVNGVCLTVVDSNDGFFAADIGPETARVTNLSALAVGRAVNLERPMRLDGRLDGHLVLGHVDGTGTIEQIRAEADAHWVTTSFPAAFSPYFIHKGSVAVDGVSLTVAALRDGRFDVQIVPYTWEHTTFGRLAVGDIVNLECDMIGKYVVRAVERTRAGSG
jgi:riboflavin synthase